MEASVSSYSSGETIVPMIPLTIAGHEVITDDVFTVTAPWDSQVIAAVPLVGVEHVEAAIGSAWEAMQKSLPAFERATILDRAAQIVRERRETLARSLAREAGKPLQQARIEVDRAVQTLLFSAVAARSIEGDAIPLDAHPNGIHRFGVTLRVPVGVVGAITPFNYPLNLAAHKIGPAIAAGCGVVIKPALKAPLTALELVRILHEAGLPPQWLSAVLGEPETIADVFAKDDRVGLIAFTGSSEIGWTLRANAPRKRVTLELGNSTPVIVCADADLDAAARASVASGYVFAGQSCISVQRVLVDERIHREFLSKLLAEARKERLGDPLDPASTVGPLITREARDRVAGLLSEAVDFGATVVVGDPAADGHLGPIVLDGVSAEARAWSHELFGPAIGVRGFSDFDEAVELANGTSYGLQAGVFTRDIGTAIVAAERLRFGGVTINETPTFRADQMPYGGTKASGNTKEGPRYAVREMMEERLVVVAS
jgi:acyl-CoA reductase-like NAD-dependent aldehyde dehydrogenase